MLVSLLTEQHSQSNSTCILLPGNQILISKYPSQERGGGVRVMVQLIWMATEYK